MSVDQIKRDFNIRKMEINDFLSHLKSFESSIDSEKLYIAKRDSEGCYTPINYPMDIKHIQKSSIVISLYNLVEFTVTRLLEFIHESIVSNSLKFNELNDGVRVLSISHIISIIDKKKGSGSFASDVLGFLKILHGEEKYSTTYEDMIKYYSLYSGNLDAQQIRQTFIKYGFTFDGDFNGKCSELKSIREGRNELAHGEISFSEYGRTLGGTEGEGNTQKVSTFCEKTFIYLENLIEEVNKFVSDKKYRRV